MIIYRAKIKVEEGDKNLADVEVIGTPRSIEDALEEIERIAQDYGEVRCLFVGY